jgi:hypothetical protein
MSATPGELSAAAVIDLIGSGRYPRDVVMTIARGFLPLAQEDLVAVLAYLAGTGDEEIAGQARTSLSDIPSRVTLDFAANETVDPSHLMRLMNVSTDVAVIEALIRNRSVPDFAIAELAGHAAGPLQEIIVINQARILRAPEILDALLANPALTAEARRRALETREEFFDKKARLQAMADLVEPEMLAEPDDAIADLLQRASELDAQPPEETASTLQTLTESEEKDDSKKAIWTRLQFMSVSEKVQLAFRGDRMVRMLLVRDRNKLICSAVMRNPRMSEQEAEAIAGMRNVDEEVLRLLSTRRDFMSKYNIMLTLARNPKAPIGVVLPFINRLTLRDLKALKDDKGVQQVIREMARKTFLARNAKS